jgi:putative spermidine/putrescine transport system permease protein
MHSGTRQAPETAAGRIDPLRPPGRSRPRAAHRVAALLHRAPRLRLAGLLAPALLWLVLLYVLPLGVLLATAFFDTDSFTGRIIYAA